MFFTLLVLCGIAVALVFGIRACIRNPSKYDHWHVDADVQYVYEGDSVVKHYPVHYDYTYDHGDYDTVYAEFASPTAYCNAMVLYYTKIKESGDRKWIDIERLDTLFYVPDRRFRVVDISVSATPRITDTKQ